MKTKKLNLSNIKDVINRDEMRKIMAGSDGGSGSGSGGGGCPFWVSACIAGNTQWAICNCSGTCSYQYTQPGCYA